MIHTRFKIYTLVFAHRNSNRVVHALAQLASVLKEQYWIEDTPPRLLSIACNDIRLLPVSE